MQLHSGKALMLLLAYTTTDESLRAHPLFARCTPRLRCSAQHMTGLLLLVVRSSKLQCVIFPVGGVAEGDDLAPNRGTNG